MFRRDNFEQILISNDEDAILLLSCFLRLILRDTTRIETGFDTDLNKDKSKLILGIIRERILLTDLNDRQAVKILSTDVEIILRKNEHTKLSDSKELPIYENTDSEEKDDDSKINNKKDELDSNALSSSIESEGESGVNEKIEDETKLEPINEPLVMIENIDKIDPIYENQLFNPIEIELINGFDDDLLPTPGLDKMTKFAQRNIFVAVSTKIKIMQSLEALI